MSLRLIDLFERGLEAIGSSQSRQKMEFPFITVSDVIAAGALPELVEFAPDLFATSCEAWKARVAKVSLTMLDILDGFDDWSEKKALPNDRLLASLRVQESSKLELDEDLFPNGKDVLVAMRALRRRRGLDGSRRRKLLIDGLVEVVAKFDFSNVPIGRKMMTAVWAAAHPLATVANIDFAEVDNWINHWTDIDPDVAEAVLGRLAAAESGARGDLSLAIDMVVVEAEVWVSIPNFDRIDELLSPQIRSQIETWMEQDPDPRTAHQLRDSYQQAIRGNDSRARLLKQIFSSQLEYDTGGVRAEVGFGPSRMNRSMVRRLAMSFAATLKAGLDSGHPDTGHVSHVLVAYDCRADSDVFAREFGVILEEEGLRVSIMTQPTITPMWSFAIRHSHADAGVMITASHNHANDSGIKFADRLGAQLVGPYDVQIMEGAYAIRRTPTIKSDIPGSEAILQTSIKWIDPTSFLPKYIEIVSNLISNSREARRQLSQLRVAYSPLHGTAGPIFTKLLDRNGLGQLEVVKAQFEPHPRFPTLQIPNPEEAPALEMCKALAQSSKAHVGLVNDPDGDRLGVLWHARNGEFIQASSDEIAAVCCEYLLRNWADARLRPIVCSTVVSSPIIESIAVAFNAIHVVSRPGFAAVMSTSLEALKQNSSSQFCFGYEAALGYGLASDRTGLWLHEKDGVAAGLVLCAAVAEAHSAGKNFGDLVDQISAAYGRWSTAQRSMKISRDSISSIMSWCMELSRDAGSIASGSDVEIDGQHPTSIAIQFGTTVRFDYGDKLRILVRRSGTESKLKFYAHSRRDDGPQPDDHRSALGGPQASPSDGDGKYVDDYLNLCLEKFVQKVRDFNGL